MNLNVERTIQRRTAIDYESCKSGRLRTSKSCRHIIGKGTKIYWSFGLDLRYAFFDKNKALNILPSCIALQKPKWKQGVDAKHDEQVNEFDSGEKIVVNAGAHWPRLNKSTSLARCAGHFSHHPRRCTKNGFTAKCLYRYSNHVDESRAVRLDTDAYDEKKYDLTYLQLISLGLPEKLRATKHEKKDLEDEKQESAIEIQCNAVLLLPDIFLCTLTTLHSYGNSKLRKWGYEKSLLKLPMIITYFNF